MVSKPLSGSIPRLGGSPIDRVCIVVSTSMLRADFYTRIEYESERGLVGGGGSLRIEERARVNDSYETSDRMNEFKIGPNLSSSARIQSTVHTDC